MLAKLKTGWIAATLCFLAVVLGTAQMGMTERRPLTLRVIQSGHSLTDPIPDPLRALVVAAGHRGVVIDRSTIPGSPMDWRWNNASSD